MPLVVLTMGGALVSTGPASAAAGCAPAKHAGGDWPMFGHDYSNSRFQDAESKIGTLEAATLQAAWAWSSDGKGDFTGTPVIVDGCVYIVSNAGWAFAVNADTGKQVWATQVSKTGGSSASPGVADGRVFVSISDVGKPFVAALDQRTGKVLWQSLLTDQPGSDAYASPIEFDGMVFTGWSGGSAELSGDDERAKFQGGFTIVDAATGKLLKRTYVIHPPSKHDDFAGAGIWGTPAIDPKARLAYVGTGNPFQADAEHRFTNSILKIDLDRSHGSFGEIVDHFRGIPETYANVFRQLPCFDPPDNPPPYYPQGLGSCMQLDLDFGASPNLFSHGGVQRIGAGQKSGIYWTVNARTMKPISSTVVGVPASVGGVVGSTAVDGDAVYGPTTQDYLWATSIHDGSNEWFAPVPDGAHYSEPVAVANGVVYTVDLRGALDAFDAATGAPLLSHPMQLDTGGSPSNSWGGVSIARNTVYAAVGVTALPTGYVIAYRPA